MTVKDVTSQRFLLNIHSYREACHYILSFPLLAVVSLHSKLARFNLHTNDFFVDCYLLFAILKPEPNMHNRYMGRSLDVAYYTLHFFDWSKNCLM